MDRKLSGLELSKAITGFLQHKAAEALSPRTLTCYEHDLELFLERQGDVDITQVSTQELRAYLAWLRTDYQTRRIAGRNGPLSPKTIRNAWMSLSAFYIALAPRGMQFENIEACTR